MPVIFVMLAALWPFVAMADSPPPPPSPVDPAAQNTQSQQSTDSQKALIDKIKSNPDLTKTHIKK